MSNINRVKYENQVVKCFDGRTKTGEFDLSEGGDDEYFAKVEALESHLVDELKWTPGQGQLRADKDGEPIELDEIEKILRGAKVKPKSSKKEAKPVKEKAERKPKKEREEGDDGKKRMKIDAERRQRKTERTPVEDALDAYVIEMSKRDGKGRRVLNVDRLMSVAKENGVTVNGMDNGHKKMNVQNSLRARYRRGDEVLVNGESFQLSEKPAKAEKKRASK